MVLDLAGNRAEFDACITECRPGEFLCWEAMDGPQLSETVRLEAISDSMTRVIAELQVDARELMPSERHATEVLDRRLKADLDGFKRFLEEQPRRPKPTDMPLSNRPHTNERPAKGVPVTGNLGPMQSQMPRPGARFMPGRRREL